jgi:hypothetical protein
MNKKDKYLKLRVDSEFIDKLETFSDQNGKNKSKIVRKALEIFLKEGGKNVKKYVNNLILKTLLVDVEFSIIEVFRECEMKTYIPNAMVFVDKAHLLENDIIVLEGYMNRGSVIPVYITLEEQEKALNNYFDSNKVRYLKTTLELIKNKLQKQ